MTTQNGSLTIGDLTLRPAARKAFWRNRDISLTTREFALLFAISEQAGRTFSRKELLEGAWGRGLAVELRTVDAHMTNLRRKLRKYPGAPLLVETVRSVGYRLRLSR